MQQITLWSCKFKICQASTLPFSEPLSDTGLRKGSERAPLPFLLFQSYCSDPDLVLDLKNLIVLFADTLQVRSRLGPSPVSSAPPGTAWESDSPFPTEAQRAGLFPPCLSTMAVRGLGRGLSSSPEILPHPPYLSARAMASRSTSSLTCFWRSRTSTARRY